MSVHLNAARRVVIKIGSALLVDAETGALRLEWLQSLVADLVELKARGADVVLVSSGSIALGRQLLHFDQESLSLDQSQAAAAVGQIHLARAYQEALAPKGLTAGQILVTLDDSDDRRRYLNMRATMLQLLGLGVVPIVNENDTVATDEIRYGDNDRLAAQVAVTLGADCLILLSDVDGLYTANPNFDPSAQHIPEVLEITPEIEAMAGEAGSRFSKGGMKTKLMAAKLAVGSGCAMAIMHGAQEHPIARLAAGAGATWFAPKLDPQDARKAWIAAMRAKGVIIIDDGAMRALLVGKSLLPAGVSVVSGDFERGDPVAIEGPERQRLGQGLCRYTAREAGAIKGHQSHQIEQILGYPGRASLIHRDDMSLEDGACHAVDVPEIRQVTGGADA